MAKYLYVLNRSGVKQIKISIGDEVDDVSNERAASIKIIGYKTRKIRAYDNVNCAGFIYGKFNGMVELTYHGGRKDGRLPKVHIKGANYITVINDNFNLKKYGDALVPVLCYRPGFENECQNNSDAKPNATKYLIQQTGPVDVDVYVAGAGFKSSQLFDSFLSLSLIMKNGYMSMKNGGATELCDLSKINISLFRLNDYFVIIRETPGKHMGRPEIEIFNNKNFCNDFLGRRIAYQNEDGSLIWTDGYEQEARLKEENQRLE